MTPTEKQKCIAEQSVYGDLHFVNPSGNVRKLDVVSSIVAYSDKGGVFKPILRPLSDLTKPITHRGYNSDKPFIPLVECERLNAVPVDNIERSSRYFDLFHQWHFDTRKLLEKSEAISTDEVNPYEV